MSGFVHLKRRPSGIYVVRLVVPGWLRHVTTTCEVHRTTGCRDLALAKIVAAEMAANWHGRIARLRHMDPRKIKAGSVDLIGEGQLPLLAAAALLGAKPEDLARRLDQRGKPFFVQAEGWLGWLVPELHRLYDERDALGRVVSVDTTPSALAEHGEQTTIRELLSVRFSDEALAIVAASEPRHVTIFTVGPTGQVGFIANGNGPLVGPADLQVRRADVEALRQELAAAVTPEMLPVAVGEASGALTAERADSIAKHRHFDRPVSELTKHYLLHRVGSLSAGEVERQRQACSALIEFTDDMRLGLINRDVVRGVGEELRRVPHRRDLHKRRLKRTSVTWRELIEVADREGLPRVSPSAVERLMEDIQAIFEWGVTQSWLRENPARKLSTELFAQMGGVRTPEHQRRDAFTQEDLAAIFGACWFASGVGRTTAKGVYFSYRPHYYWMPLMALFTGGRVNELAQLYLDDIREAEGIGWYLDFNLNQPDKVDADEPDDAETGGEITATGGALGADAEAKRFKTVSAVRIVPIHRQLIDLGLLRYVETLRYAGHERLFPELKWNKAKGYGKPVSSWFNDRYLGRELKIERNGRKVFHSFRHNFATALERAGAPPLAIKQLMGHSTVSDRSDTAPGYKKARQLTELVPIIGLLEYTLPPVAAFEVDGALKAIDDALKLKAQQRKAGG